MLSTDDAYGLHGVSIDRAEVHGQELRLHLHTPDRNVVAIRPDGAGGVDIADVTSVVAAGY